MAQEIIPDQRYKPDGNFVVNIDENDVQMIIIDDKDDEEILKLTIESSEINIMRWFVNLQTLPSKVISKSLTKLDKAYQLLLVTFVICHYLYILGAFKNKTLEEEEMHLTLTSIKNFVWCGRQPLYVILGVFYFRSTHFETLVGSVKLTSLSLNNMKRWIRVAIVFVVLFSVFIPAGFRFMEMRVTPLGDKNKAFSLRESIGNITFTIIARLVAIPIVIAFIIVFAFLYFEIRQFKKRIGSWPVRGRGAPRNEFLDIQDQIKKAERAFQPFMICHIAILLLVVVPGILGVVERERNEGTFTHFYDTTDMENLGKSAKSFIHTLNGIPNITINASGTAQENPMRSPIVIIVPMVHKNPENLYQHKGRKVNDEAAITRIALQSIAFLAEMLSLYFPLVMLGKINKAVKRTVKAIQLLKFNEQEMGGYLFQTRQDVEDMLKDLTNAHGVHLLGMELTVLKTLLLGLFMPLFTLLLHIMFKHVDLSA